jgi:branched-chain amino acid aminotransferase
MPISPHCWLDGQIMPVERATIGLGAAGLHYSATVFDGIRTYGGRPYLLGEHLDRLQRSAQHLGFSLPWTTDELALAVGQVQAANAQQDFYLRPIAWVEGASLGLTIDKSEVRVAIMGMPAASSLGLPLRRLSLELSQWQRPKSPAALDLAKCSSHYSLGSVALAAARSAGYDEPLMLDSGGFLCETSTANIFLRHGTVLSTPSPRPALAGLTRGRLLQLAAACGYQTREQQLVPTDALTADEIFLCGTYLEIASVYRLAVAAQTVDFGPAQAAHKLQSALSRDTAGAIHV